MKDLKIVSLYSGSTGNATLIATRSAAILIDAGKSARSLCAALRDTGVDIDRIDAIFITHEHTDHISALEVLEKKHAIPVHMTEQSATRAHISSGSALASRLVKHPPHFEVELRGIKVSSFCTSHDSAMSVGYRVEIAESGESYIFGLATDTGCVTEDMRRGLCGCQSVLIESNHDVDMLLTGSYPPDIKRRILSKSGHLSNEDCAAFAAELAKSGTRSFTLGHISEENNSSVTALDTVTTALSGFDGVCVSAACADRETIIIRC